MSLAAACQTSALLLKVKTKPTKQNVAAPQVCQMGSDGCFAPCQCFVEYLSTPPDLKWSNNSFSFSPGSVSNAGEKSQFHYGWLIVDTEAVCDILLSEALSFDN